MVRIRLIPLTVACVVAADLGCSAWKNDSPPGYLPSWDEARQALDWALSAWRDSNSPPERISSPSVQFVDRQRRPDDRLASYQILAQTDVENARQFTVRLKLEGQESPQLVRYVVLGRDPVWVFRSEDFDLISHWEHKMDDPDQPPVVAPKAP